MERAQRRRPFHLNAEEEPELPDYPKDPFERAAITSNTFWDWNLNHVHTMYGVMDEVFKFAATFKEFKPRSFPPSFNPANIMEEVLGDIKTERRRATEKH